MNAIPKMENFIKIVFVESAPGILLARHQKNNLIKQKTIPVVNKKILAFAETGRCEEINQAQKLDAMA